MTAMIGSSSLFRHVNDVSSTSHHSSEGGRGRRHSLNGSEWLRNLGDVRRWILDAFDGVFVESLDGSSLEIVDGTISERGSIRPAEMLEKNLPDLVDPWLRYRC